MSWFRDFEQSLNGQPCGEELIGAGTADAERSLRHYRYQHQAKLREAVEETYPILIKILGATWNAEWKSFWQTRPQCPRSLDYFSEVFLTYWLSTEAPQNLKELARFECAMDSHSWSHCPINPISLDGLNEDSKLILAPLDIHRFAVQVTELYEDREGTMEPQAVLLWLREDGLRYRAIEDWEEKTLQRLHEGVSVALEEAPQDGEAIGHFFQWLGQSGLITAMV